MQNQKAVGKFSLTILCLSPEARSSSVESGWSVTESKLIVSASKSDDLSVFSIVLLTESKIKQMPTVDWLPQAASLLPTDKQHWEYRPWARHAKYVLPVMSHPAGRSDPPHLTHGSQGPPKSTSNKMTRRSAESFLQYCDQHTQRNTQTDRPDYTTLVATGGILCYACNASCNIIITCSHLWKHYT